MRCYHSLLNTRYKIRSQTCLDNGAKGQGNWLYPTQIVIEY